MMLKKIALLTFALYSLVPLTAYSQDISIEQLQLMEQYKKSQNQQGQQTQIEQGVTKDARDRTWDEAVVHPTKNVDTRVFGREIFDKNNVTFAPNYNIPTPANYILGPGDQVFIDIWGVSQQNYDLKISPDGNIKIPNVGLVHISGLTVTQAQQLISKRIAEINESLENSVSDIKLSLGNIRSIQVNVIGEASSPGTYTIPSLATLFNVLYAAGGVSDIGSVRDIKLYRNGKVVAELDVYDYLLHGKNTADIRLQDNDLIVVAPYGNLVSIVGSVKRPKSFELKNGETFADLLNMSGGFDGYAYDESVLITRADGKQRELITLSKDMFQHFKLNDKDSILVKRISDEYKNRVMIEGAVWRPGSYELSPKISTVKELIEQSGGIKEKAYTGRAILSRLRESDLTREAIALNLADILSGKSEDLILKNKDELIIYGVDELRERRNFSVRGEVNKPLNGEPYLDNLTIEDVIIMAGGLKESASKARLEVYRRIKDPNSTSQATKKTEVFSFTIPEDLSVSSHVNQFKIEPFDEIYIRKSPAYRVQTKVYIQGEVVFPGEYALQSTSDRLSDLVKYSGGLTSQSYIEGAHLKRLMTSDEMARAKSIMQMMNNMNSAQNNRDTMIVDMNTLTVSSTYPIGINLQEAINNPGSDADITLKDGDILVVPEYNGVVKISGAVYFPNAVSYNEKLTFNDYIEMAGGYSKNARRKPFVVYMNGMVAVKQGLKSAKIEPGCEIIVPSKVMPDPVSLSQIIGVVSSSVSMLALVANLLKK